MAIAEMAEMIKLRFILFFKFPFQYSIDMPTVCGMPAPIDYVIMINI